MAFRYNRKRIAAWEQGILGSGVTWPEKRRGYRYPTATQQSVTAAIHISTTGAKATAEEFTPYSAASDLVPAIRRIAASETAEGQGRWVFHQTRFELPGYSVQTIATMVSRDAYRAF